MKIGQRCRILVFTVFIYAVLLLDAAQQDRRFSERENRLLAVRPDITFRRILDGSYMKDYETYISDQFAGRDGWIRIKTISDLCLNKREINGVFPLKNGRLLELHEQNKYEEMEQKGLERIERLIALAGERYSLSVMLIPTADAVYSDDLPRYAPSYDQWGFLDKVQLASGECFVPAGGTLLKYRDQEIYYRTDHHWTTLGAYYGYTAWARHRGVRPALPEEFEREAVAEDFLGTLQSKLNLPMKGDTIEVFNRKGENPRCSVSYDLSGQEENSIYAKKYLNTKDKYSFFLDGNHALTEIRTDAGTGRKLLVIKDSYANCFIPFLLSDYETVTVVDFRHYKGDLKTLLDTVETDDILVLYNVIHFLENPFLI